MMKRLGLMVAVLGLLSAPARATSPEQTALRTVACDGATTGFAFNYAVNSADDLKVILVDQTTTPYTATRLTMTTHYTVTAPNGRWPAASCTVTTLATYSSSYTLVITTDSVLAQTLALDSVWRPITVERALDKIMLALNEQRRQINQAPHNPDALGTSPTTELPGYGAAGYVYRTAAGGFSLEQATDLVVGTDVQAHDADLDIWAVITPHASWRDILDGTTTTLSNLRTVAAQLGRPYINVKTDYGAIPDDDEDDTEAIQAALAACGTAGGGVVFVPAGTFLYSGILQIPSYTRLVGTGPASILQPTANTTIRFTGVNRAGIEHLALIRGEVAMSSGIRVVEDSNDIVLRGLYVRRYGQPVHLYDGNDVKVQDCLFEDCGYEVVQENNYACNRVHVDRCTFRGGYAFSVEGNAAYTTDVNDWSITNSVFLSHADYPTAGSHDGAIALSRVRNAIIAGNIFWRIAGSGVIHLEDVIGRAIIANNVFEDCVGGYGYIDILNNAKDTTISNNIFVHTNAALTSYGVRSYADYYTNDLTITGNRFIGNGDRTFTAVGLSYMSTGRKIITGNHAELCNTAFSFLRTDNVLFANNTAVSCNTALRVGGGNNDDWTVSNNHLVADVNAISVPHDATHPRNRRWVVSGNRCDPNVIAYNAQNWTVYGNQIVAGGTWSIDNGACQFLRAYLNTTADSEPNLYQPGQTLTAAAVTIGGPAYTPDGWWKLDDDAASTAVADSSGNGYHMAAQANTDTLTTAGVVGTALTFNGTSDYASIGSAPFSGHASGTVSFWVKANDPAAVESYLFATADPSVTTKYLGIKLYSTTGKIGVAQRNADTADNLNGSTVLQANEWYHVAVASDNSDYFLYVNGEAEALTVTSGSNTGDWMDSVAGAANVSIGAIVRSSVVSYFAGVLDDVRVYSETLTASDIAYLYRAQRDSGAETFAGTLTVNGVEITGSSVADDTAYDATSWNDNMDAATKNAIRDKFESLGGGGFDATALDDLTWSDGANAANTWTFNVSGTDTTMIFGSGMLSLSHDLTVTGSDILVGAAGVKLTGDGDGAITFLGLGDGYDEDLTLNLDDAENAGTFTSSTGLATLNFSGIALQESGVGVLNNDEIDASAELAAIMDDETGTAGALVFSDSPTFVDDITLATAGVLLTGANGSLTILGKGDGQDEDIKLDLNTTANTLTITSPTSSLDKIDASGITITATFAGALTGNVTGDVSGSSGSCTGTAAVATAVTITDNESTAENNPLVFVADGDLDGGNLGLETDGDAYYTPSTGIITATGFAGALTGNVTGDVSGNAGTVTNGVYTGDAGTVFLAPDGDGSSLSGVVTSESDPVVGAVSGIVKADGKTAISAATGADVNDLWGSVRDNLVYASPDGSPGTAIFRALVADDIPDLSGTYAAAGHDHSGTYVEDVNDFFGSTRNNLIYASPDGSPGDPIFRALVADDIPDLSSVYSAAGHDHSGVYVEDVNDFFGSSRANLFYATPNGSPGEPILRAIVAADVPTLNQNTSGTAANLSGTPALPNGTTATTQAASDNSTKLATTAYVDTGLGGKQATVTEGSLSDSVIVSADIKDGEVGAADLASNLKTFTINFVIDGGGSEIADNVQLWAEVPCSGTITAARLLADQSGSIVVDVWKDTYANYPPTNDDSITSATPPTISGAVKSEDVTLTSWTTTVTAGDIIKINVDSCTTITKCTLVLSGTKS